MRVIVAENLTKHYTVGQRREGLLGGFIDLFQKKKRIIEAVNGISFEVKQGETLGLIGPNGAGKSTTIKMLTGILTPTGGELKVMGLVPQKNRTMHARKIGVVFGQRSQLWWDLAVIEALRLLAQMYRVNEKEFNERIERFDEVLDLKSILNQQVRKLSLGQRMRADLAASLLHNPPVLFLDEPTIGMDVAVKARMRDFIRTIRDEFSTTILLTTHDTSDIEELCERLLLIDRGLLLFDGTLERFKEAYGLFRSIQITFRKPVDEKEVTDFLGDEALTVTSDGKSRLTISFDPTKYTAHSLIETLHARFPVGDFQTAEVAIEAIVRDIYEGFYP